MTPEEQRKLRYLRKLRADFNYFGKNILVIRDKDENNASFEMNRAQRYVHERLEEQKREKGWVRAMILKGRQQGISTYVAARYYHRASLRKNVNVYIMAHDKDGSDNLFKMVERYHKHNPAAPHTGGDNAKELEFDRLGGSYAVGTAGQKAGGRGKTISLYHGSEVAFWPNAKEHFKASVQAVPKRPNTEVILESTANGPAGEFYERWQKAEAGIGDYIAIFVPWYWQEEYVDEVPDDFELSAEEDEDGDISEAEYMELYGLTLEQMVWRRNKIEELGGPMEFKQEYPATATEAFQVSSEETYIKPVYVLRARKRTDIVGAGPLILGVDPAGAGGDRFAIAWRRGYAVEKLKWRDGIETADAHQWLKKIIDDDNPDRVFIDAGGIGGATISLLKSEGPKYRSVIRSVNFGAKSETKTAMPYEPGPKLRTDEMWVRMYEWLQLPEGVSIPDLDVLQADLVTRKLKKTLTNDLSLETKDEMRARQVRSPDLADAIALTFASLGHIKGGKADPKPKYGDDRPVVDQMRSTFDEGFGGDGGPYGWMGC